MRVVQLAKPASVLRQVGLSAAGWLQRHAVTLLRTFAVLAVIAVTAFAGFLCYGLIGPPG